MPTITNPEDVKKLFVGNWLVDTGVADEQIQYFIEILEGQAAAAIHNFVDNVATNTPTPATVKRVVAGAIIDYVRASLAPYASESQSADGFSRSVSSGDNYRRKLILSADELATLSPVKDEDGGIWMIQAHRKPGYTPRWETPWYSLDTYERYWDNDGKPLPEEN